MPNAFISVKIIAPPTNTARPCNGGVFNLDVEVKGTSGGAGMRYKIRLYDDDVFADDHLESSPVLPVAPNQNFTIVTPMTLECNADCEVAGSIGSSGESTAEIYAYAIEQIPMNPASMSSQSIDLICDNDLAKDQEKDGEYSKGK